MRCPLGAAISPFNAFLLAQFPLAHSLLLSPFGARVLKRLAPPVIAARMPTTTYVIVAAIQVLLLFVLWTPSGTMANLIALQNSYAANAHIMSVVQSMMTNLLQIQG